MIGTCSLHTVHRSAKTAFDKSNIKIKETLKGGSNFCVILLQGKKIRKAFQDQQSIHCIIVQHVG